MHDEEYGRQVWSGRGADAAREYRILSRCAHGALVRALALFVDVPAAGAHTLVLEVKENYLFDIKKYLKQVTLH